MSVLSELATAVESGNQTAAGELTQKALDEGLGPFEVMLDGLQAGLRPIGKRFKAGEAFIPEVLLSARAMQAGMRVLRPLLSASNEDKSLGTVVLGTVKEDLHDIGKNMVGMMLEGAGFKVVDLGVNVEPSTFVAAIKDEDAHILCMSALLSTTMKWLQTSIQTLEGEGIRDKVKVMVGGAPVTSDYAAKIGADGFSEDAARAVDTAKDLLGLEADHG